MLETIKNVVIGIGDFIVSLDPLITGYIKEITSLIDKLYETILNVNKLLGTFFPVTVAGLIASLISVVFILRVVGRF